MNLSAKQEREVLLDRQKKILEAINFLNDSLNEVGVEWLQLNSYHQNQQNEGSEPVASSVSDAGLDIAVANIKEDDTTINIQPINLNVVSETQHFKFDCEEFDSD